MADPGGSVGWKPPSFGRSMHLNDDIQLEPHPHPLKMAGSAPVSTMNILSIISRNITDIPNRNVKISEMMHEI